MNRSVDRILSIRRYHKLVVEDLRKLNVRVRLALSYIVTADHTPRIASTRKAAETAATQLDLFAPFSALTGSL